MPVNPNEKQPRNFAERYQSVLVPVIFEPWARELIDRAAPEAGDHVLDLACGTGVVTRALAALPIAFGSLTAVDYNAEMLQVARDLAAEHGVEAKWIEADAGHLPLPDNSIDLAFCQQALQFFPDRPAALRELRRVMKPGARAVFCVQRELACNPMLRAQAAALERNVGPDAAAAVHAICSLSDRDEIRGLFEDAGFARITVENVSLMLHHPDGRAYAAGAMGGMHTGDKLAKVNETRQDRCIDDFLDGLGEYFNGEAIRFPHVSHVIIALA